MLYRFFIGENAIIPPRLYPEIDFFVGKLIFLMTKRDKRCNNIVSED